MDATKDYEGNDIGVIQNVRIGDRFNHGKYKVAEVVDFWETRSMTTGNIISIKAIAQGINTLATNTFEIPFATVVRNKI